MEVRVLVQKLLLALLWLCFSAPRAHAAVPDPKTNQICVFACYDWTDHITFALSPELEAAEDDYYFVLCNSQLKIKSIYACAQVYCPRDDALAGLNLLNRTCAEEGGTTLPSFDSLALSPEDLAKVPRLDESAEDSSSESPIDYAVVPDEYWFGLSFRTDSDFYYLFRVAYDYCYGSFGFWGLVLLVGMIYNAVTLVQSKRTRPDFDRTQSLSFSSKSWLWIRRQLVIPATFGKHCQNPVGWVCTVPPRLETVIIFLYYLYNFIICFPGYDLFDDNLYFGTKPTQVSRYISDRTGLLSVANVSIAWLFATRNNPFLWLTGWSFSTFNRFHRWVARLAFIHAFIHSVGWSIYYIQDGTHADYIAEWSELWFWTGAVATTAMGFIIGLAFYIFRAKVYDLFLLVHILLAVLFLVTLWYHLQVDPGKYDGFIWAPVAIWSLDRLVRLGRIAFKGLLPRVAKGAKAIATYDVNAEIIRLDVTRFFSGKQSAPGYFYFVYTPGSFQGWESHPFTLCSWSRSSLGTDSPPALDSDGEKNAGATVHATSDDLLSEDHCHSFLIRPYGGFTKRLRNKIAASHEKHGSSDVTVFLEGPYGSSLDLSRYSDVLIIAGGSGITIAVSQAYFLLSNGGNTNVRVAWASPQKKLVDDICANEMAAIARHPRLELDVYLTSEAEPKVEEVTSDAPYKATHGRPDIFTVMRSARQKCGKDLAIVSCGTPLMADDCRAAVVRLLKEPGAEVGYYNETLTW